jgi:hypothetical protein
MSIKVKGPNGSGPAQNAPNMEFAYRSLVSSSRQKLFESVLNQARTSGEDNGKREINSLQAEIKGLQKAGTDSQKIDRARQRSSHKTGTASPSERGVLGDLTTSALMRLAALRPQGGAAMNGYFGEAMGTRAVSRSAPQGNNDAAKSGTASERRSGQGPGSLSARFESGDNGVGVIGYDEGGGTSYGLYQISSRAGTMTSFLDYLEEQAPQWAAKLRSAGRANTGSTGGAMPKEWKKIAAEDPERFAQLQHDFIEETHYLPALEEIQRRTGLDVEKQSRALQEVLWSTAVQHGARGATNIFCRAVEHGEVKGQSATEQKMISSVYDSRAKYAGSLSSDTRSAVWRRFQEEKSLALAMLANEAGNTKAQA